MTIHTVEKLPKGTTVKEWEQLPDEEFVNVGYMAEIAYGDTVPVELEGEPLQQSEKTDTTRGRVWVLRDSYSSYRFSQV